MTVKLYGLRDLETSLQTLLADLADPEKTITTKDIHGNDVISPDLTPIFSTVMLSKPKNLSLYEGSLAILRLGTIPSTGGTGIGKERDVAQINGTVYTFIPGDDDNASLLCKHYTDIVGAMFKDKGLLASTYPGTVLSKPTGPVHDFKVVIVDPASTKNPRKSTASITNFMILKPPKTTT